MTCYPERAGAFWPGTIKIHLGKPIPTQGLSLRQVHSLMEQVRETVIQKLK